MKKRAKQIAMRGVVVQRHEANPLVKESGDSVVVNRGVLRSLVMACPDGCGEVLTINLDARAGMAWRYYERGGDVSLFPSVWRDTGCKSHFILWRNKIFWCDLGDELDAPMHDVMEQVYGRLTDDLVSYAEVAESLDLVPWAVLSAARRLCRQGAAQEGKGKLQGHFKRG